MGEGKRSPPILEEEINDKRDGSHTGDRSGSRTRGFNSSSALCTPSSVL